MDGTAARSQDPSERLAELGLSVGLIHSALRSGASRANNRSAQAPLSARGTDIYLDGMEHLSQLLLPQGWRQVYVGGQLRLMSPDQSVCVTIAAATGLSRMRKSHRGPRTNRKGRATRSALTAAPGVETLFDGNPDIIGDSELERAAAGAELWLLLNEGTQQGLYLQLSRPSGMTDGGAVNAWAEHVRIPFLELDGDLTDFLPHNDDEEGGGVDVVVEPR